MSCYATIQIKVYRMLAILRNSGLRALGKEQFNLPIANNSGLKYVTLIVHGA